MSADLYYFWNLLLRGIEVLLFHYRNNREVSFSVPSQVKIGTSVQKHEILVLWLDCEAGMPQIYLHSVKTSKGADSLPLHQLKNVTIVGSVLSMTTDVDSLTIELVSERAATIM